MSAIVEYLKSWGSILPRISFGNVLEILIIAFLVYVILSWVMRTRSFVLLRGLFVIFLFVVVCMILRLDTILWILGKVATVAAFTLIVIFQPELRMALEHLGRRNVLRTLLPVVAENTNAFTEKTVNEIVKAAFEMGKVKTGALMVIEKQDSLEEIERTGIGIDGKVSNQLLINIFEHNTPLHDGAVVIRGNLITAATCYLPLSDNMTISKNYGTRHRAALGISEVTDSITVVVSEETGNVSVARQGKLQKVSDADELRRILQELVSVPQEKKFSFKGMITKDNVQGVFDKKHRA